MPVMMRHLPPALLACLLALSFGAAPVRAADVVGVVDQARGEVYGTLASNRRELSEADAVYAEETLSTGSRGLLVVKLKDGTQFALTHSARFVVERFSYRSDAASDTLAARVLSGAFRFVSGLIAKRKPASMRVGAGAVATIGVRGTHVGGEVDGDSATIVLLEAVAEGPNAITVSNQFGSVDIDEAGYGTNIPDAHSPPSPPQRMRLRTIENLMRSLQSARRVSAPRPFP